jgi:sortase family protein
VRAPVAVLVLGLALAVGIPAAWATTRPGAAAGPPVAAAVAAPPAGIPTSASTPGPDRRAGVAGRPADVAGRPAGVAGRPAAPTPAAAVVPPVRLTVPASGIDASLDPVGVGRGGAMALPADVGRVGWYRFGPAPGAARGSAVLAGHVDDVEQGLGALAPLRAADPGTEILVTDAAGSVTRWRVVSRELIDKRAVPFAALFARSGPPRLVLLTCGGPFLPELRSYRDNVVVVAEPVG